MTKNMREMWSDFDFQEMTWHDSIVHSISIPSIELKLKLDIDYILERNLSEQTNLYEFVTVPVSLVFNDVLNLNLNLEFGQSTGLYISEIRRCNKRLSPNGKVYLWDYEIDTDKGSITFESSEFMQKLKKSI